MRRHSASYLDGIEAEWLAAILLRVKGYRILEKRFAAAGGEVDLIACRFGTLVFVEVKVRATMDQARISISEDKKRRVERAARVYLSRLGKLPPTIRVDAIFLAKNALPRHEKAIVELHLD